MKANSSVNFQNLFNFPNPLLMVTVFGISDSFHDQSGREAHLSGPIAAALMSHAADLLASAPFIESVDILVANDI